MASVALTSGIGRGEIDNNVSQTLSRTETVTWLFQQSQSCHRWSEPT